MDAIIGFHLVATAVFVLGSLVVGVRLVMLARRTRQRPELFLGSAIIGTAFFGYGVLIFAGIVRGGVNAPGDPPQLAVVLTGVGQVLHDVGVTFFFLFVLAVFRPEAKWARVVVGVALTLLWGGLLWGAVNGSFHTARIGSVAWWCEYGVIWTYPVWLAIESLRYWLMLRRRAALGLADPMVMNRFALWGTGSLFSGFAIWIASSPFFFLLTGTPELVETTAPMIHVATAISGLASISCSYLAFLPPAWYARRVQGAAAA